MKKYMVLMIAISLVTSCGRKKPLDAEKIKETSALKATITHEDNTCAEFAKAFETTEDKIKVDTLLKFPEVKDSKEKDAKKKEEEAKKAAEVKITPETEILAAQAEAQFSVENDKEVASETKTKIYNVVDVRDSKKKFFLVEVTSATDEKKVQSFIFSAKKTEIMHYIDATGCHEINEAAIVVPTKKEEVKKEETKKEEPAKTSDATATAPAVKEAAQTTSPSVPAVTENTADSDDCEDAPTTPVVAPFGSVNPNPAK